MSLEVLLELLTVIVNDLGNTGAGGPHTTTATVAMAFGPAVTIEATDPLAIREGVDTAALTARRAGDVSAPLTVNYSMSGTAAFGADYTLAQNGTPLSPSGTLSFAAGEAETTVVLTPIDTGATDYMTFEMTLTGAGTGCFVAAYQDKGTGVVAPKVKGLDASKKPEGSNHEAAQTLSKGTDVKVGVIEPSPVKGGVRAGAGINSKKAGLGEGATSRLKYNNLFFTEKLTTDPMVKNKGGRATGFRTGDHAMLVSSIIAGNDAKFTGVAPESLIYAAFIDNYENMRVATDYLYTDQGVRIFNMSLAENSPEAFNPTLFVDWFARQRDSLFVVSAGNSAQSAKEPYVHAPGDAFNSITVAAVGSDFQTRAPYSDYRTIQEFVLKGEDFRSLPNILAPGGDSAGRMSNGSISMSGTSFAAPAVSGIAALLAKRQTGDLRLGVDDAAHLGYKAIILNSARKRNINGPEATKPYAKDNDATKAEVSDKDYLAADGTGWKINDAMTPAKTAEWTPSKWSAADVTIGTNTYKKLVVTSPLDDEQGTGLADAKRALIQYNGGTGNTSGKQSSGDVDSRIGWDIGKLKMKNNGTAETPDYGPNTNSYNLNFTLAKGDFITATLLPRHERSS